MQREKPSMSRAFWLQLGTAGRSWSIAEGFSLDCPGYLQRSWDELLMLLNFSSPKSISVKLNEDNHPLADLSPDSK